ncbi:DUF262 domain-containing protein [Treponema ruminis]|uniref:GmrSD restriction endonucleases N-terminal domain-containing protein n=1 Tax=Treponema ruminis TaxID=744515 RepID=A0A7W8GA69_9SPIR|nr:DUF262 domain-containing protein [Treponema ruminis]MBB5226544.1 hypothetical protein [Treponema ruminis]QSI02225.1 DUF262 domain-containing protein [Treponema ruminis]
MGFAQPISIRTAVEKINKDYFLPAIQREFVWTTEKIELLFDSIMRGYPISSFLFWEVNENNIPKFQFYEFIRNFHEKNNRHNEKANLIGEKSITAILDEWIMETYPNESDRKLYMQRNYIPDCGLAITNFKEFIEKRKDLIRNAIKEKL